MKNLLSSTLALVLCAHVLTAQPTNIIVTNTVADQVLRGSYSPQNFAATNVINQPEDIVAALEMAVQPDSLKSYIVKLASFHNRNTGADTISQTTGIGAARRWVHAQFEAFSSQNEGRLQPAYLQFNELICNMGQHRNIIAVLPGTDTANHGIIIVEGHMDSRCQFLCDTACSAEGVEDNATGTALVIEMARVMSGFSFKNTIVFMVTIGEEQGLMGANAMAVFCKQNTLPLRAVFNNDVIGGIICGKTSSAPGCPGLDNIDSTHVRLFSAGGFNSPHKQLARFIKLEYREELEAFETVKMGVHIMSPEDRTGRGGDHIPFRQNLYPAMRFTSANEHGDASNNASYTDRQHTDRDVLGADTDGDQIVDSFFVDFNYLSRNAKINANAFALAAMAVRTPTDFTAQKAGTQLFVNITDPFDYSHYRVMLRSTTNDFDTVYTLVGSKTGQFEMPAGAPTLPRYVSVATVDTNGIESLFSKEIIAQTVGTNEPTTIEEPDITLHQNRPNPFDEATWISFFVKKMPPGARAASIRVADMQGKPVAEIPIQLTEGHHEVLYEHGYGVQGMFVYSLLVDGVWVASKSMIFAY
jgi:Peptidase family M28